MSVDILGTNCDQCRSTVHCCFPSTETVRLIRTESPGRPPRLSHSSWTLRQIIIRRLLYKPTHVAYASTNRTQIVWIETELFFFLFFCFSHGGKRASCLRACFDAMFEFNVALRPQRPYGLLETGRPGRATRDRETVRATRGGETVRATRGGETVRATRYTRDGETVRATRGGETVRATRYTRDGETVRATRYTRDGETVRATRYTRDGETVRATRDGETVRATRDGETVRVTRYTRDGETVRAIRDTRDGETVRATRYTRDGETVRVTRDTRDGETVRVTRDRETMTATSTFTQLLSSDAMLLPQSYQSPNSKHWFTTSFLQGGGCRTAMLGVWSVPKLFGGRWQRRCGHKKCPFSGVTSSGRVWRKVPESDALSHTPSTAFRHLPPNSAWFSYATEGALFISAQKSSDAVSALRKILVPIWLWKQPSAKARTSTRDASTPG